MRDRISSSPGGVETKVEVRLRILKVWRPALVVLVLGALAATNPGCAGPVRRTVATPPKIDGGTGLIGSVVPSSPGPWGQLGT